MALTGARIATPFGSDCPDYYPLQEPSEAEIGLDMELIVLGVEPRMTLVGPELILSAHTDKTLELQNLSASTEVAPKTIEPVGIELIYSHDWLKTSAQGMESDYIVIAAGLQQDEEINGQLLLVDPSEEEPEPVLINTTYETLLGEVHIAIDANSRVKSPGTNLGKAFIALSGSHVFDGDGKDGISFFYDLDPGNLTPGNTVAFLPTSPLGGNWDVDHIARGADESAGLLVAIPGDNDYSELEYLELGLNHDGFGYLVVDRFNSDKIQYPNTVQITSTEDGSKIMSICYKEQTDEGPQAYVAFYHVNNSREKTGIQLTKIPSGFNPQSSSFTKVGDSLIYTVTDTNQAWRFIRGNDGLLYPENTVYDLAGDFPSGVDIRQARSWNSLVVASTSMNTFGGVVYEPGIVSKNDKNREAWSTRKIELTEESGQPVWTPACFEEDSGSHARMQHSILAGHKLQNPAKYTLVSR
jgi:hypothetical protein